MAAVAIGLLGDVMLGRMVGKALQRRPPETLWTPELRELAVSLDLVVCNLECAISARGEPTALIPGKPFFFRGPPVAARALTAMGVGAAGLANNHALDYGPEALSDTVRLLTASGVAVCGAGATLQDARRPAVVAAGAARVGLVAVADHPAEYAAGAAGWGTAFAPLRDGTPAWLREHVAATRARCDLVIAFPHWGPNMTERPATWQRRAARELHAAGADLVAGHSAHVFHGVGWSGGPTLFDLGDALDDYAVDLRLRNDLGVLAIWRPDQDPPLELVGLRLEYCRTGLATGAEADWIDARLRAACAELGTSVTRLGEQRFAVAPMPAAEGPGSPAGA